MLANQEHELVRQLESVTYAALREVFGEERLGVSYENNDYRIEFVIYAHQGISLEQQERFFGAFGRRFFNFKWSR